METTKKKMKKEENHKHKDLNIQYRKKGDIGEPQAELEARLKTQEYKEMLKPMK